MRLRSLSAGGEVVKLCIPLQPTTTIAMESGAGRMEGLEKKSAPSATGCDDTTVVGL